MKGMETIEVAAGANTLLNLAKNASTVTAVAELVWNSIDADACNIDISVILNDLGNAESMTVTDNGHGMTHEFSKEVFRVHGESWKSAAHLSKGLRRPLHGRMGRGRFCAFALGRRIQWQTVSGSDDARQTAVIVGEKDRVNVFTFDGPFATMEATGTVVSLSLLQDRKVTRLVTDSFSAELTVQLAPTLLARRDIQVTYRGKPLNPDAHVTSSTRLPVDVDPAALRGHGAAEVLLIEWASNMDRGRSQKNLQLCDRHGNVVASYALPHTPPAPVHWSAYLLWEGFEDPELMADADHLLPTFKHGDLLDAAHQALVLHLNERLEQQRGALIHTWKARGVYPYTRPPATAVEEIERDLFDVVAVVASPGIGDKIEQQRLSLHLLQEGVQSTPGALPKILHAVLKLSDQEQEVLSALLERTQLASIVKTARTVADRADFLRGLNTLLYSDETRTTFREVDQLHPMVVREPWIFGEEWNLTLSESGLSNVVKHVVEERGDAVYESSPVLREDGRRGRVDLFFYKFLTESEKNRHLVVELKRPMQITPHEIAQVTSYADAITEHAQIANTHSGWDFWLVGTNLSRSVRNQLKNASEPGVPLRGDSYRIHVVTWAELIERGERRVEAFRRQLEMVSDDRRGFDTYNVYTQSTFRKI